MTPVLLSLIPLAGAAPLTDPVELVDAESEARSVIEDCRRGKACAAHELADAFLVRATAAAVLRGEVDQSASANLRLLKPELADTWKSLLAEDGKPDTWVVALVEGPSPVSEVPAGSPVAPVTAVRDALAAGGFPEVRLEGDAWVGTAQPSGRIGLEVRGSVLGALSVRAAPRFVISSTAISPEVRSTLETSEERINGRGVEVDLGFGPRWTTRSGSELMFWVGPSFQSHAASGGSFRALASDGVLLNPAEHALGASMGGLGTFAIGRVVSVRGDVEVRYLHRATASTHLSPQRADLAGDLEFPVNSRDEFATTTAAEVRLHPVPAMSIGLGASIEVTTGSRGLDLFPRPRLSVGYRF